MAAEEPELLARGIAAFLNRTCTSGDWPDPDEADALTATGGTNDPRDQALCLKPENFATLDQAMCAELDHFDPSVMVAAQ
jgi:hypothetical protein